MQFTSVRLGDEVYVLSIYITSVDVELLPKYCSHGIELRAVWRTDRYTPKHFTHTHKETRQLSRHIKQVKTEITESIFPIGLIYWMYCSGWKPSKTITTILSSAFVTKFCRSDCCHYCLPRCQLFWMAQIHMITIEEDKMIFSINLNNSLIITNSFYIFPFIAQNGLIHWLKSQVESIWLCWLQAFKRTHYTIHQQTIQRNL